MIEATPPQNPIPADGSTHVEFDSGTKGGAGAPEKDPEVSPDEPPQDKVGAEPGVAATKELPEVELARITATVDASTDPNQSLPFPKQLQVQKKWFGVMTTPEQTAKLTPLNALEIAADINDPVLKRIIRHWKLAPVFSADLLSQEDSGKWPMGMLREIVGNAFSAGKPDKHFYTGTAIDMDFARHRVKRLLLNLAVTPRHYCPEWNPKTLELGTPTFMVKLLYLSQIFFGNVNFLWLAATAAQAPPAPFVPPAPLPSIFGPKSAPPVSSQNPQEDSGATPTLSSPTPTATPIVEPPRTDPTHFVFAHLNTPGHSPLHSEVALAWRQRDEIGKTQIRTFLAQLYAVDPTAKLYRFPAELNTLPGMNWIHKHSYEGFFPINKRKASVYFYKHWIKDDGDRSTTQVHIGYTVPLDELLRGFTETQNNADCWHDAGEDQKFFLTPSILQVADTRPVSWLHGTTFKTNLANLGRAINSTPAFASRPHIKVELSMKYIQRFPGELVDRSKRVYAAHVWVESKYFNQTLVLLARVYNEKKKCGYPESKKFHMVPDMSSPSSNVSQAHFENDVYGHYIDTQRDHTKTVRHIPMIGVVYNASADLSAEFKHNLYAAIAGIHDKTTSEEPSFCGLDQDTNSPHIWYLSARAAQYPHSYRVSKLVGLIFSSLWGPKVWDSWFTPQYRQDLAEQYSYDSTTLAWVSSGDRIFRDLARTGFIMREYTVNAAGIPPPQCVISNLSVLMEGAHLSRSVIPSVLGNGQSVTTPVHDAPGPLSLVPTVDPFLDTTDEDEGFDVDRDDDESSMFSAMDRSAQAAAVVSALHLPPPAKDVLVDDSLDAGTTPEASFVIYTMDSWVEETLQRAPDTTVMSTDTLQRALTAMARWYQYRLQKGDRSSISEAHQTNLVLHVLLGFGDPALDRNLDRYMLQLQDCSLADVIWKTTLLENSFTPQPSHPPRSIRIPCAKLDARADLQTALKDTWLFLDPKVLSKDALLDYILFAARASGTKPEVVLEKFAAEGFAALVAHQQTSREKMEVGHAAYCSKQSRPQPPRKDGDDDMSFASQTSKTESFAPEAKAEPGGGDG